MLNLIWLRSFLALLEAKSFQAAADKLQLAQPTVSQHIQKLEELLGVLLIHRARSGCDPTPAAIAFQPYAQSLMRLNDRAIAAVRGDHIRIGASSNVGIYLLQPEVRAFLEGRDPAMFDLMIDRNPVIAEKLSDGEIDIAVMEWWDQRPGFKVHLWRREPVVLIVPPAHPLAAHSEIGKDALRNLSMLGGEPGTGTGRLLNTYFGPGEAAPRVSLQLGSTEAVKQAVRAGLGLSLVLLCTVAEEIRNGTLCGIPLTGPALNKDLVVVWRDSGVRHLAAPGFVQHLLRTDRANAA